ncbi:hypothetical protein [Erythrobacter sp. THAF29]|uniref:hypothetical protein n=1 Tax=Erythrobacter sp. THAF29 TaxID=2587851 RepID=UPI0012685437|nr:hypothetical protein [Erythrobacter sp. THAF29]QFT76495.1 hypothetical protein FIU90_02960 [Erythrobacter sp. THAF29]
MLVERRRSAFPAEFILRVGVAWAIVSALLLVIHWSAISAGRFPDPDDILRLVQVRDLLAGQSWFDLTQYRIDTANGGVAMHWSRLVDIPLALVILVLTPILGQASAETVALVAVPLITLGIAMLLASRIAWRLMGEEEATLTSLILALSVPVLFQLSPMRIDHHGWQIVCALAAVNGLMARSERVSGWVVGASLATWLSISIEGLPLSAAIFAVLAWRWLVDRSQRGLLVHAIQAFAIIGAALFLLTRGAGDLATYCDAVSPVHLAMFAFGAAILTLLSRFEPMPRGLLLGGFVFAGGGALAILLATAPQCATGGFAELDPLVARYWHVNVVEGMPIWRQDVLTILQYAVTPVIGLIAAFNLASRSREWLRRFWFDYTLILLAAFIVSLLVARAGAVACVLAAPPLAWQVRSWLRSIRNMKRPAPRVAATAALACALLPALPAMLLASAIPARAFVGASIAPNGPAPVKASSCKVGDAAARLQVLPAGEFYAPLDIAPDLLLTTDHSVLATGHHRGDASMKVLIETALGSPDDARKILASRGTAYVIACPSLSELRNYARAAPEGFAAVLLDEDQPEWLRPVALGSDTDLKVWKVRPE